MNDNLSTYRIWAPDNVLWTLWAKPVLFARTLHPVPQKSVLPAVKWASYGDGRTAVDVTSVTEILYQGADYLSCQHIRPEAAQSSGSRYYSIG